ASVDSDPLGAVIQLSSGHVLVVTGSSTLTGDGLARGGGGGVGYPRGLFFGVAFVTQSLVELLVLDAWAWVSSWHDDHLPSLPAYPNAVQFRKCRDRSDSLTSNSANLGGQR